jgi:hypothetical protein
LRAFRDILGTIIVVAGIVAANIAIIVPAW